MAESLADPAKSDLQRKLCVVVVVVVAFLSLKIFLMNLMELYFLRPSGLTALIALAQVSRSLPGLRPDPRSRENL